MASGKNLREISQRLRELYSRRVAVIDDFALSILRAGSYAEQQRAGIFLVFAHEQILNFCSAP